ncbi:MAG: hypothetical protein EOP58_00705 [Sphingomonadales bacterium]|nr:MAG: hypothetical protein EOP58_00705 [Sphingomonadales bacterium]
MTPLFTLQLAMLATAALVAPFHRFAAAYAGCYAAGLLARKAGLSEADVNLLWHSAALSCALHFPLMRSDYCIAVFVLFAPLLLVDALRLSGDMTDYHAWWAVWWIVMAQLALLARGADWMRARDMARSWRDRSGGNSLKMEVA